MLTIVCGENSGASRNYYNDLRQNYREKGFEICDIKASEISNIYDWLNDNYSLFSGKKAYFTSFLNKRYSKKNLPGETKLIDRLIQDKAIDVIDWEEDLPARYLKMKSGSVKEFKPSDTIFKLQDACYPGNIKEFIMLLSHLKKSQEDIFVFVMIARHIRNLMLTAFKQTPSGLFSWQKSKLADQAKRWEKNKLISFYDGLYRIELSYKSGLLPYKLSSALDIMASYYL